MVGMKKAPKTDLLSDCGGGRQILFVGSGRGPFHRGGIEAEAVPHFDIMKAQPLQRAAEEADVVLR